MAELQRVKASTLCRILAGDADAMDEDAMDEGFFAWHRTPQGFDFWREEFLRLLGGRDLSPEARAYLENLLVNGRRVKQ